MHLVNSPFKSGHRSLIVFNMGSNFSVFWFIFLSMVFLLTAYNHCQYYVILGKYLATFVSTKDSIVLIQGPKKDDNQYHRFLSRLGASAIHVAVFRYSYFAVSPLLPIFPLILADSVSLPYSLIIIILYPIKVIYTPELNFFPL